MNPAGFILGILLSVALFLPSPVAATEYSLDDLYGLALKQSEKIRISEQDLDIARMEKSRALAVIMPKLTAFNTYTQYTDDKFSEGLVVQPKTSDLWGVQMDQQFSLSFREFTALSMANKNIEKSRQDLASVKEEYLYQVAYAYFSVLRAGKSVEIANANVDRLLRYRDAAEKRLRVGEVTKTVLLRAESELSGARSDKVKAENALASAKTTLARIAGIDEAYTLKEEKEQDAEQIVSVAELKDTAFSQRSELKSLEFQKKIAEQDVSYARGAFFPNLAISGAYKKADQDPQTITLNKESVYGSVSLNFPFFEGGLRKAELNQAKAREVQANLLYEDTKKTIGLDVENAYLDLMTQKGTITYLKDQLAFARDNMNSVTRQFALGLASSLDVIDANTLLVSSERQLADATYNYRISILRVKRVTGTFLKEIKTAGN
jgi:outer membrane protein